MAQKLNTNDKTILRNARRDAVVRSFSLLKRHLKQSRWVGNGNRYRKNTTDTLSRDSKAGRALNHFHLTQYVAASAPLHCADGWAFLGRALDCHSRRDYDSARHFAYYAELRAAFSLLAAEGIGIFNTQHFALYDCDNCKPFKGPTHQIVWQVLEYWAGLKKAADLLGAAIQVDGVSFGVWLDHFQPTSSLRAVGSKWLKTWGIDLRTFPEDRKMRNEASYRPTKMNTREKLDVEHSADFVCALWSLCEPSASPFENLDRHLLRLALEEAFQGVSGATAASDPGKFRARVARMLSQVVSSPAASDEWANFLTRTNRSVDPSIVTQASRRDSTDVPEQHLQMISRAALLLRVATAASSRLLKESDTSTDDLKFWWSALGEERGLWEKAKQPANLRDLWADAETAVNGIREWTGRPGGPNKTFVSWRQDNAYDISVLGGCERIALWGLGL